MKVSKVFNRISNVILLSIPGVGRLEWYEPTLWSLQLCRHINHHSNCHRCCGNHHHLYRLLLSKHQLHQSDNVHEMQFVIWTTNKGLQSTPWCLRPVQPWQWGPYFCPRWNPPPSIQTPAKSSHWRLFCIGIWSVHLSPTCNDTKSLCSGNINPKPLESELEALPA